jgi:peptidoglycan/LPS O-acetylase OafA/YrhL
MNANQKQILSSVALGLGGVVASICLNVIRMFFADLDVLKHKPASILDVFFDILLVSFSMLVGLHFSLNPSDRGRLTGPLIADASVFVFILILLIITAMPWGPNPFPLLTRWIPDVLALLAVGYTAFEVRRPH